MNRPELENKSVGVGLSHDSAIRHVSGRAIYVDDMREPAGIVHLAPGYADQTCGTIESVDMTDVRRSPGVIDILTFQDISGENNCAPAMKDDPILAESRIEFHGQVIFAVIAESHIAARQAAKTAKIVIKPDPPSISINQGLESGKTVLPDFCFGHGNPQQAMAKSHLKVKSTLEIGGQEHFYLEGQVSMAIPAEAGEMLIHSSTQHPSEVQHLVAKMLGLPDAKVTCECRRMGGAFGGKESQAAQWACLAALAASKTGRPVKIRLDRDDDMIMTGKRHETRADYQFGCNEKGVIDAVDVTFNARCGYSADLSLGVCDRTMFHADNAYFYPEVQIHSKRIKTNTVSNTAFRGFGGPQGMLFAERMMDEIAIKLNLDPLVVRKRNLYRGEKLTTPYGMKVKDNIALPLLRELEKTSDYKNRRKEIAEFNHANRFLKKGIALNPIKFGISFTLKHLNQAGAFINVYTDGSVQVNHGGTEMGQGLYIKVAQVVAEVFGLSTDKVIITATTTAKVPNTAPTAASSGSDLNGMAAKNAAETIKNRLCALAAELFQCKSADVKFINGRVVAGRNEILFGELTKRAFLERISLSATGYYATPGITWSRDTKTGTPFLYFAYGAACTEVTIDTLTGESRIDHVDILHDVGQSLNPAIDIGQIEGGFVQGMGWLTNEELVFSDQGKLRTHAPSTYKIPTASDVPKDFRVTLWNSSGNRAPTIFRSKAVGEPPLMLATSVFSAITHALASIRPGTVPDLDAPATPERIARAAANLKNAEDVRL